MWYEYWCAEYDIATVPPEHFGPFQADVTDFCNFWENPKYCPRNVVYCVIYLDDKKPPVLFWRSWSWDRKLGWQEGRAPIPREMKKWIKKESEDSKLEQIKLF